jgi:uncharacterized radical SAM protein YgiQ
MSAPRPLFGYRKFWAHRLGPAPFLPTTRAEMDALGWEVCDVVLISGDAYVDHPSFGMAIVGRLLEAQGFRVGIIAQPDWRSAAPFAALGRPALFFGVTAGNMDSMVNRYTSDRKLRSDDAYSPAGAGGLRPDRAVVVYAQRCREAFGDVPIVIGGIEASLRRIAHYDYWSDQVRRSVLVDSHADLLVYGNGERAIVEIAHRLAARTPIASIRDVRGTGFMLRTWPDGIVELDSTTVDRPGPVAPPSDPYAMVEARPARPARPTRRDPRAPSCSCAAPAQGAPRAAGDPPAGVRGGPRDPVLYAHASRVLHHEANPGNARALVQRHGDRDVWLNPPPIPLTTAEMDALYELPYQRVPHPGYGGAKIPAYEMIRFSVTILRGCFGGCSFCSITEHEGRIIQNRSEASILREIEPCAIARRASTGSSATSGARPPTCGGWPAKIARSRRLPQAIVRVPRRLREPGDRSRPAHRSCTARRALPGVKKILIASGLRYDLAVRSPAYVKELAQHHTGGYLKIAPEHTEAGPLEHMMKPGIGTYARFKELFDRASAEAGKEQYLIPYFIAAHPGTTDEDMLNLALWLKANGFRPDQVQAFLPSPMATATAMYHTGYNPLRSLKARAPVVTVKHPERRRLHKAFFRYHDPANWPMLRAALERMGPLGADRQRQASPGAALAAARRGRRRRGAADPGPAPPGRCLDPAHRSAATPSGARRRQAPSASVSVQPHSPPICSSHTAS